MPQVIVWVTPSSATSTHPKYNPRNGASTLTASPSARSDLRVQPRYIDGYRRGLIVAGCQGGRLSGCPVSRGGRVTMVSCVDPLSDTRPTCRILYTPGRTIRGTRRVSGRHSVARLKSIAQAPATGQRVAPLAGHSTGTLSHDHQ